MVFVGIERLHLLANVGDLSRVSWLLELQAFQLVIFKQVIHAILQKNNPLDKRLYVQLAQYFPPAFNQVFHNWPLSRLSHLLAKLVKVVLKKGGKVNTELILLDVCSIWRFEDAKGNC